MVENYEIKNISGFQYINTTKRVWIVFKRYSTGLTERILAFDDEQAARKLVGHLAGTDKNITLGLECINVVVKAD